MHEPTLINQPWLNRADTLCDDEGTPQSYLYLLSSQLCHLHPEFVRDLHAQNGNDRRRSRAAVIEYGDTATQQRAYETPERLDEYLQESAADKGTAPRRRLFLLEDLSRDYVGIIGSQLGIPPSFFGAHWADPTHSNFNYRSPFSRYTEENFVLRYASTLPVRIDACLDAHGSIFRYDANVNRHVHCYDPKGPIVDQPKSYHALSFWTSGARIDGSWDSILLVDPPIREHVVSLTDGSLLCADHNSKEHAYSRMHVLEPDLNHPQVPSSTTSKHAQPWIQPHYKPQYKSMFDDILSMTTTQSLPDPTDPRSCTEPARKLVIAIFLTFLRRRILNMIRLQANPRTAILAINRCDYLRQFGQGALSSWHHELFGFIVNVKYIMGLLAREVDDNMVALGILHHSTTNSCNATPSHPPSHIPTPPQWETDGWITLQDHCARMIAMAEAFLQSYLAYTSMQEAQAANRNASSLARITNLTMFFIPLSALAAIFSMTDEYLPGRSQWWVFWVAALPVLGGTFAWMREGGFGGVVWGSGKGREKRTEKGNDKEEEKKEWGWKGDWKGWRGGGKGVGFAA